VQVARGAGLDGEARGELELVVDLGLQHLDDRRSLHSRLLREVDRAHAALAELLLDAVLADHLSADEWIIRQRERTRGGRSVHRICLHRSMLPPASLAAPRTSLVRSCPTEHSVTNQAPR